MMPGALGCWIDGVTADAVPADDRGLQYGDGLFETITIRSGCPRFLELHLARLAAGCLRLGITFDAFAALRSDIARACASAPALGVLKVIVTRGSALRRGYSPRGAGSARRIVTLWPAAPFEAQAGVDLRVATMRLAEVPQLAGMKHLNRLENVLAAAEAPDDPAFDSLLLDTAGHLICGTMCNVFVGTAGRIATPRVDRAGVAGVMRAVVLRECAVLGIPADERRLTLDDVYAADEAFVTNARVGVVQVCRVGEHAFDMSGTTRRLRDHIEALDA